MWIVQIKVRGKVLAQRKSQASCPLEAIEKIEARLKKILSRADRQGVVCYIAIKAG